MSNCSSESDMKLTLRLYKLSIISGALCNMCARGYTGHWPHCEACGECFRSWDEIVQKLKAQVKSLIGEIFWLLLLLVISFKRICVPYLFIFSETANNIEDTGIASVYDDAFEKMEKSLMETKTKLDSANITRSDVNLLQAEIDKLMKDVRVRFFFRHFVHD